MMPTIAGLEAYGAFYVLAMVAFAVLITVLFRRNGVRLRHAAALTVAYVLSTAFAAKLLYDYVKAGGGHTILDHPSWEHFTEGGLWGWQLAFFPIAFAYPFLLRIRPAASIYRAAAFALPPVIALQKVGCFLHGCCGGRRTTLPWAVVFPEGSAAKMPGVPVHPVQLYDAALPLVALGILIAVDRRGGRPARAFLLPLFVGLYALSRFGTEFLRAEHPGGLRLSQWVELATALAVIALLALGRAPWRRLLERQGSSPPDRNAARREDSGICDDI